LPFNIAIIQIPYKDVTLDLEQVNNILSYKYTIKEMIQFSDAAYMDVDRISEALKSKDYLSDDDKDGANAWEIIDDICEGIRENKWEQLSATQRFDRLFEVIQLWPNYTTTRHLFSAYLFDEGINQNVKQHLWQGILKFLASTKESLREPVEYVLWVDFFEDQSTCEEAWHGLMNLSKNKEVTNRLLINAGPVPYIMKKPIYQLLLSDKTRHSVIAESLARSLEDVYGDIDHKDARLLLKQLKLLKFNKYVKFLSANLEKE